LKGRPAAVGQWVETNGFTADTGQHLVLPDRRGRASAVLFGLGENHEPLSESCWVFGGLPLTLPEGVYQIRGNLSRRQSDNAALGWLLGTYRFNRYKSDPDSRKPARLIAPARCDLQQTLREAEAMMLIRDLVNIPAADLGPEELEQAALRLASSFSAESRVIRGEELLDEGCRLIHAVGRASDRAPRLIDFRWGNPDAPKLTLVGKGVCFDSGGIQIKSDPGIRNMKFDMGGAAHVLGLAQMIMSADLPVRLRVLVPAVENSISGNAYRPGDVITARNGVKVQIEHTDAEGRLVLADALAMGDEEAPALMVDFATLTGAVTEALGADIPGLICSDQKTAIEMIGISREACDQVWPLPFWQPYSAAIESSIADVNHIADGFGAGVITSALFLNRFIDQTDLWCHLDLSAWNAKDRPGRPQGGEARGIRAMFSFIRKRFGPQGPRQLEERAGP